MNKIFELAQIIIPPPPVAGPPGLTLAEIADLIAIVGSFFTSVGVLLAIIAIIWSGLVYMNAGGDENKIKKAKAWFRNALLGALIVLGVGLIINTIANIISREFFCILNIAGFCIIP